MSQVIPLLGSLFFRASKLSLSGVHNALKMATWNVNGTLTDVFLKVLMMGGRWDLIYLTLSAIPCTGPPDFRYGVLVLSAMKFALPARCLRLAALVLRRPLTATSVITAQNSDQRR